MLAVSPTEATWDWKSAIAMRLARADTTPGAPVADGVARQGQLLRRLALLLVHEHLHLQPGALRGGHEGIAPRLPRRSGVLEHHFVVAGAILSRSSCASTASTASREPVTAICASRRQRMRSGSSLLKAYQHTDSGRQPVGSKFVVGDDGAVSFALDDDDSDRELVIDPVLQYSTYLGGGGRRRTTSQSTWPDTRT